MLRIGLLLIRNIIKPLAKNVLIPLWLTAAASAAHAGIQKNISGSGRRHSFSSTPHDTALMTSNDEMKDIIEIVKSLRDFNLLLKGVSDTFENEFKEQKEYFLVCYLVHWVQVYYEIF